jgi:hypothetical protein
MDENRMEVHMRVARIAGTIAAIVVAGSTAFAQTDGNMTVTGCLMKEADYRKAHHLGKGALGGLGLGDEFVLVEGSCDAASGTAYRVTGKKEEELKPFVGHRLEVTGQWDHKRDAKIAAGEVKAKLPPEIKIASFRDAPAAPAASTASAAPAQTAPATSPAPEQTVASNETPTRSLPHTASNLPLVGLIGLLSLVAFFGVRLFPTHTA